MIELIVLVFWVKLLYAFFYFAWASHGKLFSCDIQIMVGLDWQHPNAGSWRWSVGWNARKSSEMVCKLHSLAANEQERERRKQRPEQSWHMVSHRKEGEGQRLSQREKEERSGRRGRGRKREGRREIIGRKVRRRQGMEREIEKSSYSVSEEKDRLKHRNQDEQKSALDSDKSISRSLA